MKYSKHPAEFTHLFKPLQVGPFVLKNRIIKAPTGMNQAFVSGEPSPEQIHFYEQTARGGAGLVTIELVEVDERYMSPPPHLRIDNDIFISGLHRLIEVIHLNGSLVSIQLHHAGYMSALNHVAPSALPVMVRGREITPRALSEEEIEEAKERFVQAAARAKLAGADMVELHGARTYLIHEFVSPRLNKRTDRWGGSFENRIRFPLEIVRNIIDVCGAGFPVGYKMVADEMMPYGITPEEATELAVRLEAEGVAYLSVQLVPGDFMNYKDGVFAMRSPVKPALDSTERITRAVNIPVFTGQQVHDPALMEKVLADGVADAICSARPLLADPELPEKIRQGRLDDIRLCLKCGHCFNCIDTTYEKVSCTMNPALGRGREWDIAPAAKARKVLVVGGGPAGLEAARVAALRGHHVTVMEKEQELGGQMRIACLPLGKEHFRERATGWLERQCRKNGVRIVLGETATGEAVERFAPDVLVIATGARPAALPVPGIDRSNVIQAWDVLSGASIQGDVVVVGGGMVGVETAEMLAAQNGNRHVAVVEMLPTLAADMDVMNRAYLLNQIKELKIEIHTGTKARAITDIGLEVLSSLGAVTTLPTDNIVLAVGAVPDLSLAEFTTSADLQVFTIGDCVRPRKLTDAVREGAYAGRII